MLMKAFAAISFRKRSWQEKNLK